MERKAVSAILLTVLLINMLTLAFNTQPVRASGTIYIRADGSIDPPTAPISTLDNVTYTLTGNITSDADGIVIERSSITVDGNGYTLQGSGSGSGFYLLSINNVTVKNTNINGFQRGTEFLNSSNNHIAGNNITNSNVIGIYFRAPSENNTICGNNIVNSGYQTAIRLHGPGCKNFTIRGNNINGLNDCGISTEIEGGPSGHTIYENIITGCGWGIFLSQSSNNTIYANKIADCFSAGMLISFYSDNNTVYDNNITANYRGIYIGLIGGTSGNRFWHNNIIDNDYQVLIESYDSTTCMWDNDYPSGGNYWSDYSGVDFCNGPYQNETGSDGKGDTPYIIDENNRDNYPLMNPWEPTILSIAPTSTKVSVGHTFKVNITISGVLDLWSWKVKLSWNPSYLKLTYHGPDWTDADIIEGTFLRDKGKTFFAFSYPNETGGYLEELWCILTVPKGASGSGILATIAFNATALGTSTIGLSETRLLDWVNATYKPDIPHTVVNGTVKVMYLGDFDEDSDVDYDDIVYFVTAYIRFWSGQGKDPLCDFDGDCDIDYDDILIFVSAYIDYWTPP